MTLALYVGIACAVIGALFWICARVMFPAPIVEEEEPYGEANTYRRER